MKKIGLEWVILLSHTATGYRCTITNYEQKTVFGDGYTPNAAYQNAEIQLVEKPAFFLSPDDGIPWPGPVGALVKAPGRGCHMCGKPLPPLEQWSTPYCPACTDESYGFAASEQKHG